MLNSKFWENRDRRALETLELLPVDTSRWSPSDYWNDYMPAVRDFAKEQGLELREADKVLWGYSLYGDVLGRLK